MASAEGKRKTMAEEDFIRYLVGDPKTKIDSNERKKVKAMLEDFH